MAFTVEQLTAMEAAAAKGLLRVKTGDKEIAYQTMPDLLAAIRLARADVLAAGAEAYRPPIRRYPEFGRGY